MILNYNYTFQFHVNFSNNKASRGIFKISKGAKSMRRVA